jgi:hypothetical protein
MADNLETRPGPSLELLAYADDLLCGSGINAESILSMPLHLPETQAMGTDDAETASERGTEPLAVLWAGWSATTRHHIENATASNDPEHDNRQNSSNGARP